MEGVRIRATLISPFQARCAQNAVAGVARFALASPSLAQTLLVTSLSLSDGLFLLCDVYLSIAMLLTWQRCESYTSIARQPCSFRES